MKYTPGPWIIGKKGGITLRIKGPRKPDVGGGWYEPTLASVIGGMGIPSTANARLIAAAPELLVACEKLIEALHFKTVSSEELRAYHSALEVVKKATTKEQA